MVLRFHTARYLVVGPVRAINIAVRVTFRVAGIQIKGL